MRAYSSRLFNQEGDAINAAVFNWGELILLDSLVAYLNEVDCNVRIMSRTHTLKLSWSAESSTLSGSLERPMLSSVFASSSSPRAIKDLTASE